MALASKKVLIFGIDSFTGNHLLIHLGVCGFDVYGTSLANANNAKLFKCDITDKTQIVKVLKEVVPDYVVNLAAISFVGHSHAEMFYTINVLAVENILQAILECDISPKIMLVSSATVYGNQNSNMLDESMCPSPISHYGISKLAMENIAKTYFDKLDMVITRPFNYVGTGQDISFVIPKIVSHYADKKSSIELGNIEVFREFNDIGFVCEAYKRLLESDIKSEILNICSSRTIALVDVLRYMNELAGYSIEVKMNQAFVRTNEIVSLGGNPKKLFGFVGNIEQIPLVDTLKNIYSCMLGTKR